MKMVAVTGASGFVGRRVLVYNKGRFQQIPVALRSVVVDTIDLAGADVVIHLAGKAHQMQPINDSVYFDVNYGLTRQLADRAKAQGVKHFVYISSTKVFGDEVHEILTETSACHPTDAYGASKLKAEQYLQSIQSGTFKVAIVRPPLIYGPEVKGNMIKLMELANKRIPLPLGNVDNQRSMVFVDNLIELINVIIDKEADGIFIGGDSAPLSTTQLLLLIKKYLNNNTSLLSIPNSIRQVIKRFKPALYSRLFGSFVVDNTGTCSRLQFIPPYSSEEGIASMVNWYINREK